MLRRAAARTATALARPQVQQQKQHFQPIKRNASSQKSTADQVKEFFTTDMGKTADGNLWGAREKQKFGTEAWEIPAYVGFGGPALVYFLVWNNAPDANVNVFARRELDERERLALEAAGIAEQEKK